MKTNDISAPASDGRPVAGKTSNVGIRTRQLECMRAFQAGHSWYEAYWYPQPRPRRRQTLSMLVAFLEGLATPRPAERIVELKLLSR